MDREQCLGFVLAFLMAFWVNAIGVQAQNPPETSAAKLVAPEFDAVTIKPDPAGKGHMRLTPDSFSMGGMPAWILVRTAYGVLMEDQVEGLPGWAKSEPIAVEARIDPETTAALNQLAPAERWKQLQRMMQAMLADRFGLKAHPESRDLPIYLLTVARGGLKMNKTSPDGSGGNARYDSGKIAAHGISVESLAANLGFTVGRLVVNKTGVEGGYDFTLDYAPDGADASDTRPSIFTALEEQLGLKLEPAKGPVDVIVVDHMERPTAN